MSNKTRKRIWPVSVVAVIGMVAILAALAVTAMMPGASQAQGAPPPVAGPSNLQATADSRTEISLSWSSGLGQATYELQRVEGADPAGFATIADDITGTTYMDSGLTAGTQYSYRVRGVSAGGESPWSNTVMAMTEALPPVTETEAVSVSGWSSSSNGSDDLTINVNDAGALGVDDSIILVLEDDFAVPDSIPNGVVFFRQAGSPSHGARTYASVSIDSEDDGHAGDDAHTIRIYVPDMDPADNLVAGLADSPFGIVIPKQAGIKNPGDAKDGGFKVGYQILTGDRTSYDDASTMALDNVVVKAKVSLDDENNKRGYELSISGTGFNKDSSATAYVAHASAVMAYWDTLDCDAMNALVGSSDTMGMGYCQMWAGLDEDQQARVAGEAIGQNRGGVRESIGSGTVGDDYKVVIMAEVTGGSKGDFVAGNNNYIGILDDNSPTRRYSPSAKLFDLQHSIAVEPSDVASGEEVTVKLRDYAGNYMVSNVSLDGKRNSDAGHFDITPNKGGTNPTEVTFDMPGGVSGAVEVAVVVARPAGDASKAPSDKTATITVNPSSLDLSQSEVAPNASVIISGSGFNEGKMIAVENITIDDERLVVDDAGTVSCAKDISDSGECVQVTSSGEFTATVRVWTHRDSNANPALDDDEFTIKVKDEDGFEGKAKITIKSATVKVTPETASPRDFIVISGENWPISTPELDNSVTIEIDNRMRQADVDSTGRFRYEYQLRANIGIGDEHDVTVTYKDPQIVDGSARDDIEEETTFSVVEADISVNPAAAAPGQTISVSIGGMRPYTLIDEIRIGRVSLLGNQSVTTDREGDAMVSDITVPYLDPGHYPVTVQVGNDTRVVEFEMLAEATVPGVAAELPGAVSDLGDNLEAIFHFNNVTKAWTFYDPRPEFADLNTLTELHGGQPYWVLVKDSQDDVDWNGRLINFTCAGGDCWNLEIW